MVFETTDQIFCDHIFLLSQQIWPVVSKNSWFLRQRTKFFETTGFSANKSTDNCSENRFQSVGALTKFSGSPTDFVFRCRPNIKYLVYKNALYGRNANKRPP
jgi:hypothetical protein